MLKRKKRNKCKVYVLIAAAVLLLVFGVDSVVAYLIAADEPVENRFIPAVVNCSVIETFDGETKTDVKIKNTGNVDAYVRVKLVITWQSEGNSTQIHARQPKEGVDYHVELGEQSWIEGSDGFWYYREAIEPEADTEPLIKKLQLLSGAPEGYQLSVTILASAIQAEPSNVVAEQWGVSCENAIITAVP